MGASGIDQIHAALTKAHLTAVINMQSSEKTGLALQALKLIINNTQNLSNWQELPADQLQQYRDQRELLVRLIDEYSTANPKLREIQKAATLLLGRLNKY